jgi:hypothetical protein
MSENVKSKLALPGIICGIFITIALIYAAFLIDYFILSAASKRRAR